MSKILILVPKHIFEINGTSNYAYKLCYFLLNKNHDVDVFYFFESNKLFFERKLNKESNIDYNKEVTATFPIKNLMK